MDPAVVVVVVEVAQLVRCSNQRLSTLVIDLIE